MAMQIIDVTTQTNMVISTNLVKDYTSIEVDHWSGRTDGEAVLQEIPNLVKDYTFIEVYPGRTKGKAVLREIHELGLDNVVLVERDRHTKDHVFTSPCLLGFFLLTFEERVKLPFQDEWYILFYTNLGEAFRLMTTNTLFVSDTVSDTSAIISHEVDNDGMFVPVDFQ